MLITNIGKLVTMEPCGGREGPLGIVKNAAIEIEDGKVMKICSSDLASVRSCESTIDAKGCVVIPGLIDCHTHLVHAGNRADEFAARARGASYVEIAKAGGGIMSTVKATRSASEDELFVLASDRAKESLSHGVTTIEVKSGYGLDLENELKILRVVKRLNQELPLDFIPTFLGAHTIPLEYLPSKKEGRQKYIKCIIEEMLPVVAEENLAKFCDIFVEKIAFTWQEAEKILRAAKKHGLKLKIHADQLSSSGGSSLAAKLGAISADHLENITGKDLLAMKKAGVTAVLIPTSTFFVGGKYAPARAMIRNGMNVAISTDYNPGTSPILNLWLAASVAITQMKLTPEEAYRGITINAARALGMEKYHGSICKGKVADVVILNTKNEFDPFYRFDKSFIEKVVKGGNIIL